MESYKAIIVNINEQLLHAIAWMNHTYMMLSKKKKKDTKESILHDSIYTKSKTGKTNIL